MAEKYSSRCIEALKGLGAPLTDWTCVQVDDMDDAIFICELCSYDKVRFVHVMEHPDWPGQIRVGCVCDGTMSGDMLGAEVRDREARNKARRRKRFLSKQWVPTGPNRWALDHTDREIWTSMEAFRGCEYFVLRIENEAFQWWNNLRMNDLYAVKIAAFELLEHEKQQQQVEKVRL